MAEKKNGRARGSQPAKPSRKITEKVESVVDADRGMTIREEFAVRCLAALLSNPRFADPDVAMGNIHGVAIHHADELLAELAKEQQA